MRPPRVRPAQKAGQFYPADPRVLRATVDDMLAAAPPPDDSSPAPRGLLAPHAGYIFSGPTAACAYRQLQGRPIRRVVIFGPSHYVAFAGASVYDGEAFETPLGRVPLDTDYIRALLAQNPPFDFNAGAHAPEHSIEVQLPFLQSVLGEFQLAPILLHDQTEQNVRAVAGAALRALSEAPDVPTVFIASSDLYHGYDREECARQDARFASLLEAFDGEALMRGMRRGECMACGMGALAATLAAARSEGATGARVLRRTNSHEAQPDSGSAYVVGYAAAMFA